MHGFAMNPQNAHESDWGRRVPSVASTPLKARDQAGVMEEQEWTGKTCLQLATLVDGVQCVTSSLPGPSPVARIAKLSISQAGDLCVQVQAVSVEDREAIADMEADLRKANAVREAARTSLRQNGNTAAGKRALETATKKVDRLRAEIATERARSAEVGSAGGLTRVVSAVDMIGVVLGNMVIDCSGIVSVGDNPCVGASASASRVAAVPSTTTATHWNRELDALRVSPHVRDTRRFEDMRGIVATAMCEDRRCRRTGTRNSGVPCPGPAGGFRGRVRRRRRRRGR